MSLEKCYDSVSSRLTEELLLSYEV